MSDGVFEPWLDVRAYSGDRRCEVMVGVRNGKPVKCGKRATLIVGFESLIERAVCRVDAQELYRSAVTVSLFDARARRIEDVPVSGAIL